MDKLKKEVREKTLGYILAALGLVAGLAWNEAFTVLIERLFPLAQDTVVAKFFYAAIITTFVVIIASYLARFSSKAD